MRVYVTKYGLTDGVQEREGRDQSGNYIWTGEPGRISSQMFTKGEWFLSREEAADNILKRIGLRRKSIAKELQKLNELEQKELAILKAGGD